MESTKPIVMEENRIYHPPDYTFRGEVMSELSRMFVAHDELPEHSPDCEKQCVLGLFYSNHPI